MSLPPSPELIELNHKRTELERLEQRLAERELDLSTLEAELAAFHAQCVKRLGTLYAELNALQARLTAQRARSAPADAAAERAAQEAELSAQQAAWEADFFAAQPETPDFDPPPDLKQLYREAARRVHPDRAADDADCARRTERMARVNEAYRAGDRATLEAILRESAWEAEEDAAKDVAEMLVAAIRRKARVGARLAQIDARIAELQAGEIAALMARVREASALGRDAYADIEGNLRAEIDALRALLGEGRGPLPVRDGAPVIATITAAARELPERTHATPRGELVRHAGEAAIAAALDEAGLDYRYEPAIVGTHAAGIMRPSFGLRDARGRWILWQYCGAQDEAREGRDAWFARNGFIPGINLFVTREGSDAEHLRAIADYLKALLQGAQAAPKSCATAAGLDGK